MDGAASTAVQARVQRAREAMKRAQAAASAPECCSAPGAATDDCCADKQGELEILASNAAVRRVLVAALIINAVMFFLEFGAGVAAGSAALMADAVDMAGDAAVYALSLYALTKDVRWKAGAALTKGGFIFLLGAGVLIEVGVKLATGAPPTSSLMIAFGGLALTANLVCLALLARHRTRDVNLSSTFECSRNDVLANCGLLLAAAGVAFFASPWPDILVAVVIAGLFFRSAFKVLRQAWPQFQTA